MKHLMKRIDKAMDDYSIKKKFLILYILGVIFPIILTDSVVIYTVLHSAEASRLHEMEKAANGFQYSFYNTVDSVADLSKEIYMNKYINGFLDRKYKSSLDYVTSYQQFSKSTLLKSGFGSNKLIITMYADNDTIVNGGEFLNISKAVNTEWYKYLHGTDAKQAMFFTYDNSKGPADGYKRKLYFLQKLDLYNSGKEKILVIDIDYSTLAQQFEHLNYAMPVYMCSGDRIIFSNGMHNSVAKDYEIFTDRSRVGFSQNIDLYGQQFTIYVLKSGVSLQNLMLNVLPLLILLVIINAVFPFIVMSGINHSFVKRLSDLDGVVNRTDFDEDELLAEIPDVHGRDEIGSLMRNYNRMAQRINALVQIVFRNRIKEQEMTVARQNAELLALHSQINPHFLFNALESIRMHSIIKKENETADMVEKLAVMQRQYVDWGQDIIDIGTEMDFVRAYLDLQKYRFGDRLSYELDVDEECSTGKIPKLTIVTFVENACVHGIESKTAPGWIFVRIYRRDGMLHIETEDTGSGMSEEDMKELQFNMNNADMSMLKENGRVGIINACLRLRMMSENEVRFIVDGEEGMGLTVHIVIPERSILC